MLRIFSSWLQLLEPLLNVKDPSLKTYLGKYKNGRATYTYREKPEGGRIYEGRYSYKTTSSSAVGRFKDDKKEGLWVYRKHRDVLKATYKDGVLEGPYESSASVMIGTRQSFSVTVENGHFVGKAQGKHATYAWSGSKYKVSVDFTGQFDADGRMDGPWTFISNDGAYEYKALYEHGKCRKYYREDLRTGDIEWGHGAITPFLNQAMVENYAIERMASRNAQEWQGCDVNEYDR